MTFIDGFVPFGLAIAPRQFSIFAKTFIWILTFKHSTLFAENLDNGFDLLVGATETTDILQFLTIDDKFLPRIYSLLDDAWYGHLYQDIANLMGQKIWELAVELGIILHPGKDVKPSREIEILGAVYDLRTRSTHLSDIKIQEYVTLCMHVLSLKSITVKGIQRILGKLNYAAMNIYHMCPFLRSIIDLFVGLHDTATISLSSVSKKR